MKEQEITLRYSDMSKEEMLFAAILKKLEDVTNRLVRVEEQLEQITIAEDKLLYSAREAAPILGVHYQTVLKWIREGKIGCLDGTNLIPRGEIKRMLAERTIKKEDSSFFQ